jgi:uncharacterized RDD family membrane protein YckC
MTTGDNSSRTRCFATVPDRLVALLLDTVVLSVLAFIAALIVSLALGPAVELDGGAESVSDAVQTNRGVALVDALVVAALGALYFAGSWRRSGRTPGQRLLGLHVASAAGDDVATGQAIIRWLLVAGPFSAAAVLATASSALDGPVLPVLVGAWYVVLLVTTAVSPTSRGLHDRLSGTAVGKAAVAWPAARPEDAQAGRTDSAAPREDAAGVR